MTTDDRLYRPDYDWLWRNPPHNDGSPARIRVRLYSNSIDEGEAGSATDSRPSSGTVAPSDFTPTGSTSPSDSTPITPSDSEPNVNVPPSNSEPKVSAPPSDSESNVSVPPSNQASVQTLVDSWLQTLSFEEPDLWGQGGWATRVLSSEENVVVLDLWSAGEDVADGIEAATRSLYESVLRGTDVQVDYEQLPR